MFILQVQVINVLERRLSMKVIISASKLEDNPTVDTHNCVIGVIVE